MGLNEGASTETVGARLRRLRLERGLSQRELAAPGVSYAYISRLEAGARVPSVKALRKLAKKFGVSVEYLETGSDVSEAEGREFRLSDAQLMLRFGDAAAAETELSRLLDEAAAAGDLGMAASALIVLALAIDERGDHADAVAKLEEAFALERPSPVERTDVFATLGRAYGALGQTQREIALYEGCLEELSHMPGDHDLVEARFRIFLSYALSDAGQFDRAEQVLRATLADNPATDDPYMRIRVHWSLARLSEMEGRSQDALRHARKAITLLEATEDDLQRARAHLLAAWIMNSARDPKGAGGQLAVAERLFGESVSSDDQAILRVEQARMHGLSGEGELAIERAREAIAIVGEHHSAILGAAHCALAQGLTLQDEFDVADESFRTGVELLDQSRRWREAAEACRSWAQMLRQAHKPTDALEALDRSADFALRLSSAVLARE